LIGLNKSDSMTPRQMAARLAALRKASGQAVFLLSGASGQGVPEVLRALQDAIQVARRAQADNLAQRGSHEIATRPGLAGQGQAA